jgi:hypothetical protein
MATFAEPVPMELTLDPVQWAEEQFGACELGDQRRTRRAVKFAAQVAAHPAGSTPLQTRTWSDCKAAYRLFGADDVTFESLAEPHWRATRQRNRGHFLLLGDTTEFDFGWNRRAAGLGPVGQGTGRGFMLHSALMVESDSEIVVGLAGQEIFHRQPRPRGESRYDRSRRRRESEVWGRVIDQVGGPAENVRYTHVFDRGGDNFEVYCKLLQNRCDWVVRARHLKRIVRTPEGTETNLRDYLTTLPAAGTYELTLRSSSRRAARVATLEVRFGQVAIPAPRLRSPWLRQCGIDTIVQWVVEVREANAPRGVEPLHWVLYTSHATVSFDEAWRVIGYYERRWLIEEYHKALKTGCQVEQRQYETSKRLAAVIGVLSLVAVRLMQLKAVARSQPERPAAEVVPAVWLKALRSLNRRIRPGCTLRDFCRHLAGLGGFLGRKHDGEPGWITLWRGFEKLALAVQTLESHKKCG